MTPPTTPTQPGVYNPSEVRRTLEIFCDTDPAEIRILNAYGSKGRTDCGYFDDFNKAAGMLAAYAHNPRNAGIYFTLNAFSKDLMLRASNRFQERIESTVTDADITRRKWLFVDCDPKRPAGISSSPAEHEAAKHTAAEVARYLQSQAWPQPIICSSGNGWHLHYRIDIENSPEVTSIVKRALAALAAKFDNQQVSIDTKVFNASRICKLYGTVARKGDHSDGRPHRTAEIVRVPSELQVVSWSLVESLAAMAPAAAATTSSKTAKPKTPQKARRDHRGSADDRQQILKRAAAYVATMRPAISGENGHDWAFHVACELLHAWGLSIEEATPIFSSWSDTCSPPWSDREILHKLQSADESPGDGRPRGWRVDERQDSSPPGPRDAGAAAGGHGDGGEGDEASSEWEKTLRARGVVEIRKDEQWTTDRTIELMNGPEDLFDSGGRLVQILEDSAGQLIVHPLKKESLRELISARVRFIPQGGEPYDFKPVPKFIAENILARPFWSSAPQLRKIVSSPYLSSGGRVITEPGFDAKSGVYAHFIPREWPGIPVEPSRQDAELSLRKIESLVSDFPWAGDIDRSCWLALLFALVGRDCLPGPVPAFIADASCPGSGKTLLLSVAHLVATQQPISMTAYPDSDAELVKKMTSILCRNPRPAMICFDNVSRVVGGDMLESYLTANGKFTERILGVSEEISVDADCLLTFSGNGLKCKPDFARRMLRFRLVPRVARPESRSDFKISNLLHYVTEHKRELLADVLTIWAAWHHAGRPQSTISPWGSFASFDPVRHLLRWLGRPDPAANNATMRREMDSKTQAEEAFLEQMVLRYGDEKFTSADVFQLAEQIADVRDSVEALMDRRLKDVSALAIGKRISKLRERIFESGRSLQQMEGRGRRVFYWIEGGDTTQGGGGEDGDIGEFHSATREHFDFDFSTMT